MDDVIKMNFFQAMKKNDCSLLLRIPGIENKIHTEQDERGFYPIHVACESNDTNMLMLFILLGANINSIEPLFHYTPLHIACLYQNENAVRILTQYGADRMVRDYFLQTPLEVYNELFIQSPSDVSEIDLFENPLFSDKRVKNPSIIRYLTQ